MGGQRIKQSNAWDHPTKWAEVEASNSGWLVVMLWKRREGADKCIYLIYPKILSSPLHRTVVEAAKAEVDLLEVDKEQDSTTHHSKRVTEN